jgi:hypothetical protein
MATRTVSESHGRTFWLIVSFLGTSSSVAGQSVPDSLLILGAGRAGDWVTEYSFANSKPAPMVVTVSSDTSDFTVCTIPIFPFDCTTIVAKPEIPGNGALVLEHPVFGLNRAISGLSGVYIRAPDLPALTVRARVKNLATSQSVDLPVIPLSRVTTAALSTLVFPGATRSATSHSNLVLATYYTGCSEIRVGLKIEVYSADGTVLGETEMLLAVGERFFLVDVVGLAGVSALEGGHIRVTRQSGCGDLWGIMPSLLADGSLSVSVGAHP